MTSVEPVFSILGVLAPVLAACVFAYYTRELSGLRFEVGHNSDTIASEVFLRLLKDARKEMLVCDDGNKMDSSIYEDDDVIAAVREKLAANEQFRMRCLFSDDEDTKFRRAFQDEHRVEIKTGVQRRPVHYKIIDGGRSGYLSRHKHGETQRAFKLYEGARGWVQEMALKRYIADIDQEFRHAA